MGAGVRMSQKLAVDRFVTALAVLLAAFCIINGASMLFSPARWFWSVPDVALTGGYNGHFIRDIGIVYALTGAGLLVGALSPRHRPVLFGAAAAWLSSHAAFHIAEVVLGICGSDVLARSFVGVILPGVTALGLCATALRRETGGPVRSLTSSVTSADSARP